MRYTEIDRQIEALAARQNGAFNRQQAFSAGASERFVQRRLTEGHWLRPVPAVYVLAHIPGTWKRQCKVAELSVDDGGLAGRTAAALHQLTGFRPGPIEVALPINSACRHPLAVVHRYAGAQFQLIEGMKVTTIPQTLFDIAPSTLPWKLERAMDDALLGKRITVRDLADRLTFYAASRRPGLPRIRPLIVERLEEGWVPPESELEALLLHVLARLSTHPTIVRQAALPWRSRRTGRVDVLLSDRRLIIEADGRRWHARVADFDRDRWRDNEAVANGYRVMRFTWVHLNDFSADVVDVIERAVRGATAA